MNGFLTVIHPVSATPFAPVHTMITGDPILNLSPHREFLRKP